MAITISGQNNNDKILASDGVLDSISGFNVVGVMTATTFDVTTKHTANHIDVGSTIQLGNAGIITATTLIGNVTGNVNSTSNLLLQISGSEKFRVGNGGQLGIGGANYGSSGQVLTSGGSGSAPTWSTIASDKITEGNTEAEVIDTGSDGHFKVTTEGSERLRIDSNGRVMIRTTTAGAHSSDLTIGGTTGAGRIMIRSANNGGGYINFQDTTGSTVDGSIEYNHVLNSFNFYFESQERFRIHTQGMLGLSGANYGTSGQVLTSAGTGSPVSWTTIPAQATIANNADNRVITGGSGVNLNGEANLTFNGTSLGINDSSGNAKLIVSGNSDTSDADCQIRIYDTDSTVGSQIPSISFWGGSTQLAYIRGTSTGLRFYTGSSGSMSFAGSFDNSQRLLLGSDSNINVAGHDSSLLVTGSDYNKHTINIIANENTNRGAMLQFAKNRSGSVGGATVVQDNDYIGQIRFVAADSADLNSRVAEIHAAVDGTPGANDTPGRLAFMTTPDGSDSSVERVRITSGGTTRIGDSTAYSSLGDSDYQCVIHPNRSNSSKAALGLHIKQTGGQGGGAAADSICLRVDNTANYNNATHQYGIYTDVNQQYVASTTGCRVETQGTYGQTHVFDGLLQKGVNAATDGITFKSNIVQTGTELGSTYHMRCYNNGSERLRITLGGNIQNTNNSYGQISDVKFKENIVDANSQWDDIKAIKVRNFNFKSSTGFETHKQIGVIAQELETVSAGLIDTTNDTELNESTGEGTVTGTTKYVKYSILYMKAVKALQEAQARIEALEARVATLEGS